MNIVEEKRLLRDVPLLRLTERYNLLVAEILTEYGYDRGGQAAVARRLDIDQKNLSSILSDRRRVGPGIVLRASAALGLDLSYFTSDEAPASYKPLLGKKKPGPAAAPSEDDLRARLAALEEWAAAVSGQRQVHPINEPDGHVVDGAGVRIAVSLPPFPKKT